MIKDSWVLNDHTVKNEIQICPNLIPPESVKSIAYVGQKVMKLNKRKPTYDQLKTAIKNPQGFVVFLGSIS